MLKKNVHTAKFKKSFMLWENFKTTAMFPFYDLDLKPIDLENPYTF